MSLRRTPPWCISPGFEPLEARRLLACDVKVDGRTLFVRGDAADNDIVLRGDRQTIFVTCDGKLARVPFGDFDQVQVKGGDGNDTISADVIAAALSVFGDDGDDDIHLDVDDDGQVAPTDPIIGGGGHDTINLSTSDLVNIIKILGTGNQIIPDPEITVDSATGAELAHLFVQETEAIALNTWAGDDTVEMQNNGLLAGTDWTINTGNGADDVHFAVLADPNNPTTCPPAPERLTVNLGSAPLAGDGTPPSTGSGIMPLREAAAFDRFVLDASAGWCPSDPSIPATINVLGDRGSQHVSLNFGAIGSPSLPQVFTEGLHTFIELHGEGDLAEQLYAGEIFAPVSLFADMGAGNDHFSQVMQNVRVDAGFMANVDNGLGDDRAALDIREATCSGDPSLPPGPCEPIDIDLFTGTGRDSVEANVQDIGLDFHLDASLGAGDDSFTGTIRPDSTHRAGDFMPCYEIAVDGGGGRDTFMLKVGDANPQAGPQPHLAAELEISLDGGAGSDSFLINMLNVAISGPVTINADGGTAADSFRDTFSQVAAGGGAWNVAHQGGPGNDSLNTSLTNFFAELSYAADFGSGNDSAVIAIIRKAASGLSSSVSPAAAPGTQVGVLGAAGNDTINFKWEGPDLGKADVKLDGGEGNDGIDALFDLLGQSAGTLAAKVLGGGGNDNLSLRVFNDQGQVEMLLLDGGAGKDKCQVSPNVKVQNCEK